MSIPPIVGELAGVLLSEEEESKSPPPPPPETETFWQKVKRIYRDFWRV